MSWQPTDYGSVRIKRLRCTKCGDAPEALVEFSIATSTFQILADGRERDCEGYHEPCDVTHVEARCACGHRWRLRGVLQVTDLDLDPRPDPQ